jgi:glycolate oxidase FAD binding subunit
MDCSTPQNVAELADLVRHAAATRSALYPTAGGTQEHLLAPIPTDATTLNLRSLNKLIDYPHDDLTVTIQAGMTLAELHRLLAEKNQVLPLDVPLPHQATVGGSIAANVNGPRRTGWGTWRDYVIGLSFLNDRGEEAKAGGRVVKNVAGYDICKLMTGAFGTLGILTQVTLKVRPKSEKLALQSFRVAGQRLAPLLDLLRASRVRPTVQLVSSCAESDYQLEVGFEDSGAAVDWQLAHWRQECQRLVSEVDNHMEPQEAEKRLQTLTAFPMEGAGVTLQASVPSSRVADMIQQIRPFVTSLQAYPADGLIIGHRATGLPLNLESSTIWGLRGEAMQIGGHLTLPRCPAAWRSTLLPFGPIRPDWAMMRKIKHALDPHDIFQRGRYEPLYAESPSP